MVRPWLPSPTLLPTRHPPWLPSHSWKVPHPLLRQDHRTSDSPSFTAQRLAAPPSSLSACPLLREGAYVSTPSNAGPALARLWALTHLSQHLSECAIPFCSCWLPRSASLPHSNVTSWRTGTLLPWLGILIPDHSPAPGSVHVNE